MGSENNVLMVIAPRDFRDEEYFETRRVLDDSGIGVSVASLISGECESVAGRVVTADCDLSECNLSNFGGIVFIGGPGVEVFFADQSAIGLAKEFADSEKLVAAICWASVILARADLIDGKKVTGWGGARGDLEQAGAIFTGEHVTVDGNILTADGPDSAADFGQKIVDVLV